MSEATPRPWRRAQMRGPRIFSDDGLIADFFGPNAEENLALTLQAVNSFAELVAALEGNQPAIEWALTHLEGNHGEFTELGKRLRECVHRTRAALQKAKQL